MSIDNQSKFKFWTIFVITMSIVLASVGFIVLGFIYKFKIKPIMQDAMPRTTVDIELAKTIKFGTQSFFGVVGQEYDVEPTIKPSRDERGFFVSISKEYKGSQVELLFYYGLLQDDEIDARAKLGHNLLKWEQNLEKSQEVQKGACVYVTYVYDAVWQKNKYTIAFESYDMIDEWSVVYGDDIELPYPNAPKIDEVGYGWFDGWYLDNQDNNASDERVKWTSIPYLGSDKTRIVLHAKWIINDNWFIFNDGVITALSDEWDKLPIDIKGKVIVPDAINGKNVVAIEPSVFVNNKSIVSIKLSKNITSIPQGAFKNCNQLQTVVGEGIVEADADAFYGTPFLISSDFVSIGNVFLKYNGSIDIDYARFVEEGITIIAKDAFKDYKSKGNKIKVSIPKQIEKIGDNAFLNAEINELYLPPNNSLEIGSGVFKNAKILFLSIGTSGLDLSVLYDGNASDDLKTIVVDTQDIGENFVLNGGNAKLDKLQCINSNIASITLRDFSSITNLVLYKNQLKSIEVKDINIDTLNLTGNMLTTIDITNVYAFKLLLVGNGTESIYCNAENSSVGVIYMPADEGDGYIRKNKLSNLHEFVGHLPNLVSLDIANNNVGDITGIESLLHLEELYLGGNPVINNGYITGGGLNHLQQLDASQIKRLNLGANNLISSNNDQVRQIIFEFIKKCNSLEWVQIYSISASVNDITSGFIREELPNLKYLKITSNGVDNNGFLDSEKNQIIAHFDNWLVEGEGLIINTIDGGESNG